MCVSVCVCVCVCVCAGEGGWRRLGEGTISETQQNNEGPAKVDRAWRRGTLMPLSPFGSEPLGQRQHCVGVRPLWMKGPALYSRIQALCRVGVQGREKIGSHRGQRPDGHPWMEAGHPDLGMEEGEEATQRQRDPGESLRGEDMKERERERAERTQAWMELE